MPIAASSSTTTPRLAATAPAIRCGMRLRAVNCSSGMAVVIGRFGFSSRKSVRTVGDHRPPLADFTSERDPADESLRDRDVDERPHRPPPSVSTCASGAIPTTVSSRRRIADRVGFELTAEHVGRVPHAPGHRSLMMIAPGASPTSCAVKSRPLTRRHVQRLEVVRRHRVPVGAVRRPCRRGVAGPARAATRVPSARRRAGDPRRRRPAAHWAVRQHARAQPLGKERGRQVPCSR